MNTGVVQIVDEGFSCLFLKQLTEIVYGKMSALSHHFKRYFFRIMLIDIIQDFLKHTGMKASGISIQMGEECQQDLEEQRHRFIHGGLMEDIRDQMIIGQKQLLQNDSVTVNAHTVSDDRSEEMTEILPVIVAVRADILCDPVDMPGNQVNIILQNGSFMELISD